MFYWIARLLVRQLLTLCCPGPVEGATQVPAQGGALIVSNHNSHLDPPAIGCALARSVYFMAKAELFRVPILGPMVRRLHAFPVHRDRADLAALRQAHSLLQAGELLVVFPEGTRSPDGVLGEPEPGAALIALRAGVPVVPVVVLGSEQVLPPGRAWPRRAPVTVRFGPPFLPDPGQVTGRQRLPLVSAQIMRALAELLPPERRGKWG